MVLNLILKNANVLKKLSKSFVDRNTGKETPYYQLVLDINDDVETFGCSKECFDKVEIGVNNLLTAINTNGNGKVRIIDCVQAEKK